jgi:hypothetical protein
MTERSHAGNIRNKPCAEDCANNAYNDVYDKANAASFGDSGAEPAKEDTYEDAGYYAGLRHGSPLVARGESVGKMPSSSSASSAIGKVREPAPQTRGVFGQSSRPNGNDWNHCEMNKQNTPVSKMQEVAF